MPKYRVWCNFNVRANSWREAKEFVCREDDFAERHIIVSEVDRDDPSFTEEDYVDLTEKKA